MADNTELNLGEGGDIYRSIDIGGVKHQVIVPATEDGDPIAADNPLPVEGEVSVTGTVTVGGTVSVDSLPAITGSVDIGAIAAGDNNIGNVDIVTMPNVTVGTLPSIPAGNNNIGDVDIASMPNVVIGSGTVTTVSTVTSVTAIANALPAGTNNIGDVDVLTLPALPAGNNNIGDVDVASIAAGDNNIGNVDIVTVPTDPFGANADAASATGSISAKLRGISTALGVTALDLGSGTGGSRTLRVFPDTAATYTLAAGSAAIGKLAANSGVDIGDVDVTSLPAIPAGTNLIGRVKPEGDEYETVAASQTAQTLGATGATGDYIAGILVVPANLNPGNVLLLDNATSITVFAGGTNSVSNLIPFLIPLGITSVSGAWKITTGANVSCIGMGNFT